LSAYSLPCWNYLQAILFLSNFIIKFNNFSLSTLIHSIISPQGKEFQYSPAAAVPQTKAAIILFADDPSGILVGRVAIRIFHYSGLKIEHGPVPNLLKTSKTVTGPLIRQISDVYEYVLNEIATGLTLSSEAMGLRGGYWLRTINNKTN
jgi:hypothetical protein